MSGFIVTNKPVSVSRASGETAIKLVSWQEASGTCLQGYVTARYDDIKRLLGEPNAEADGDKVTTEWIIRFTEPDGKSTVATIYDWKEGSRRCRQGEYGWHVGGKSKRAVELVKRLLGKAA